MEYSRRRLAVVVSVMEGNVESITEQLIEHIKERDRIGIKKYGHSLRAFDGRRNLTDALDEVLDLAQYLMKEIKERETQTTLIEQLEDTIRGYEHKLGVLPLDTAVKEWLRINELATTCTCGVKDTDVFRGC
mgnify:CR=1 FL=1